jgi:hypothetical protein
VPDPEMGNYHLWLGDKCVGHFYPDNEADVDMGALLARMIESAKR